jgi:hypothetical protein
MAVRRVGPARVRPARPAAVPVAASGSRVAVIESGTNDRRLCGFLDQQRDVLIRNIQGLSEEDARPAATVSWSTRGRSVLSMVTCWALGSTLNAAIALCPGGRRGSIRCPVADGLAWHSLLGCPADQGIPRRDG